MTSIPFAIVVALALVQSAPLPAPGKVARPVNDPVSVKGCLRGTSLTILETDAADLGGIREVRLTGSRSLMKQLVDYRNHYIDVVGVVKREGGTSDRIEMRRRQKVGSKTTISVGATAEQTSGGEPLTPTTFTVAIQAFEPIADKCPGHR
jgi:hypothetical protein